MRRITPSVRKESQKHCNKGMLGSDVGKEGIAKTSHDYAVTPPKNH